LTSHRRREHCRDATRAPRRPCTRQAGPLQAACRRPVPAGLSPKRKIPGGVGGQSPLIPLIKH
jgi:hypothetical protein